MASKSKTARRRARRRQSHLIFLMHNDRPGYLERIEELSRSVRGSDLRLLLNCFSNKTIRRDLALSALITRPSESVIKGLVESRDIVAGDILSQICCDELRGHLEAAYITAVGTLKPPRPIRPKLDTRPDPEIQKRRAA